MILSRKGSTDMLTLPDRLKSSPLCNGRLTLIASKDLKLDWVS